MSDPLEKLQRATDAIEGCMANKPLFGCLTLVIGMLIYFAYIQYNGPVM